MANVIVVGVDGREGSRDAVALGAALAEAQGAELVLAHVYPFDPMAFRIAVGPQVMASLERDAAELLERAAQEAPGSPRTVPIAAGSAAQGLQAVAEREDAGMLVVGSTHRGPLGRVMLGSHAESVLAGAPCAVAVAPRGLAAEPWAPRTIAVGYDGRAEAQEALGVARALAARAGGTLRLYAVAPAAPAEWAAYSYVPDWGEIQQQAWQELERELDQAADGAGTEVLGGEVVEELRALTERCDLLVLGSRGYGPVRRVLLGATSHLVVRDARCPVLVVPRSAHDADEATDARAATGDADG